MDKQGVASMHYPSAEISEEPDRPLRRGERRRMLAAAQCRRGSTREAVELLDLSATGARLRALSPLREGAIVWLKIGHMEGFEARIVWTIGFESGCEFARPLHPAVFDSLAIAR